MEIGKTHINFDFKENVRIVKYPFKSTENFNVNEIVSD